MQERIANANYSYYILAMIVCICYRVSDRDIARAVREGCTSFDELQDELAVATACGNCHDCAHATFHQHAAMVRMTAPGHHGAAHPATHPAAHQSAQAA